MKSERKRQTLVGEVISDKMENTVNVKEKYGPVLELSMITMTNNKKITNNIKYKI